MEKKTIRLDSLEVSPFVTTPEPAPSGEVEDLNHLAAIGNCTGCPSGCGIFENNV